MKKLYLIKNPDLFQGENYLKENKTYFEGWYFKNTSENFNVSFIPGININEKEKNAFIQVITNDNSYFIKYELNDFKFSHKPFYIKIGNNYFSKDKIHIDINDVNQNLKIKGTLKYSNNKNIETSIFNPNIMGPFSYIPFMECNHAILSMRNSINGHLKINNIKVKFKNDIGYIEKDWGHSFPKSYVWCQGNCFLNSNSSFILSIANIPFTIFRFTGVICVLIINDKEYKFTTYNNTKIIKYDINDDELNITLKKKDYILIIKTKLENGLKLSAPVKGKMIKDIFESITSNILITLKKDNKIIFSDTSTNCGIEIVK